MKKLICTLALLAACASPEEQCELNLQASVPKGPNYIEIPPNLTKAYCQVKLGKVNCSDPKWETKCLVISIFEYYLESIKLKQQTPAEELKEHAKKTLEELQKNK